MKKIYTLFVVLIIAGSLMAQTPQGFKYQAVARDAGGDVVADRAVGMQISILQGSTSGTAVYVETFTPTTNKFGLLNLNIGGGTVVSGDFTTIDWSADTYFIKIEMDITGGTTYEEYGISQLLSVPYALHAKTVKSITETDPVFGAHAANGITSTNITNWSTAYGWGNHSLAGYLASYTETDPIFGSSVASGITGTDTTNWNNKLDSYTETDPVFGAHAANGITSTNITNWTTAYGWGDHSLAGYLTGFTEADPIFSAWDKSSGISITESQISNLDHFTTADETDQIFVASPANGITSTNITNWTTAYGWGDHSTAGYITDGNTGWDNSYGFITASSSETLTNKSGNISMWTNDTGYLTGFTETDPVFSNLFSITSPADNQLLKYNSGTSKWENWTPNFLTTEVDGDVTNEIQDLSLSSNTLSLTNDATTVDLSGYLDNTDNQNLSNVLAQGTDAGSNNITNLADPVNDQDAATKAYVEARIIDLLLQQGIGSISDYDGNEYEIVKIGDQVWMAENLKTTYYANGDAIPDGTGAGDISGETDPEYWFAYADDLNNVSTYGRLYTWHTVSDSRNVCPDGWHMPTDAEWTTLTDYLGGTSVAGGKLKETGTSHWNSPNTGATNESGFTALPGGNRSTNGAFNNIGNYGHWWSSTEGNATNAWARNLYYNDAYIYRNSSNKKFGFSVRCVRD